MTLTRFQVSFLSACLSFPILLLMKVIGGIDHPVAVLAVGVVSLLVVFLVPRLYFRDGPPKHDPFYNVWSIFLFASLVDMVIGLENDGYVGKYLHFYLLQGEPYLKTPFGSMINYWDGTVHFALVLFVLSRNAYKYWLFLYVWSIFMFSSLVDIIIALENNGYIERYLHFYLLQGEPYLKTPFGSQICYWDGTVHLALVLYILSRTAYNEEYRLACLYWCGSILNSVAVLVPGGIIGKFGPKWSILLNVPYVVIPLYVLFKVLSSRTASSRNVLTSLGRTRKQGPVDTLFVVLFIVSILINGFRAIVALDCKADITKNYLKDIEPILADDTAFPKMQMLVYFFYFLPYYVYAIYRLIYPTASNGMMKDLAFVHAGAAAQAQFSYLTTAVHSRTPDIYRIPSSPTAQYCFWIINIALFVIPQLFAYNCVAGPSTSVQETVTSSHKCVAGPSISSVQDTVTSSPDKRDNSESYNLRKRKT